MLGVLIPRPVLDAIAAGTVTVAFRRWDRARVHPGSRLRTAVGVLEVGEVTTVAEEDLGESDAHAAGFADLAALRRRLPGEKPIFRVTLRLAGPDPRVELRSRATLDDADRAELDRRLQRLDQASRRGPWTNRVLALIADNPEVRAPIWRPGWAWRPWCSSGTCASSRSSVSPRASRSATASRRAARPTGPPPRPEATGTCREKSGAREVGVGAATTSAGHPRLRRRRAPARPGAAGRDPARVHHPADRHELGAADRNR